MQSAWCVSAKKWHVDVSVNDASGVKGGVIPAEPLPPTGSVGAGSATESGSETGAVGIVRPGADEGVFGATVVGVGDGVLGVGATGAGVLGVMGTTVTGAAATVIETDPVTGLLVTSVTVTVCVPTVLSASVNL